MSSFLLENKATTLEVCSWLDASVDYSLLVEVSYKTLFAEYQKYCLEQGIIPNTSASFSRLVRKHLKEKVESQTVKIINNKGVRIKGLELKKK